MIIAVDFDGTIVTHEYPGMGKPVPGALEKIKAWIKKGHQIVLNTMRGDTKLAEAVSYLEDNGVTLSGVNKSEGQEVWTSSPKVYAHVYVDDAAYGCPLVYDKKICNRHFVDWSKIDI